MIMKNQLFSGLAPLCIIVCFYNLGICNSAEPPVVVIKTDETNTIQVSTYGKTDSISLGSVRTSVVFWSNGQKDFWEIATGKWSIPVISDLFDIDVVSSFTSRSGSGNIASVDLGILNQPALPIWLSPTFKGWRLLSPPDQAHILNSRPIFRRKGTDKNLSLPPADVALKGEGGEIRVLFKENVASVKWEELTGLPDSWKKGLPSGKYFLHAKTDLGPQTVTFFVEPTIVEEVALKKVNILSGLLGKSDPLIPLIASELMLHKPADSGPLWLVDAFDLLNELPESHRTPYLKSALKSAEQQLIEPKRLVQLLPFDSPTGEKSIDEIRGYLAVGHWGKALNRLDALEGDLAISPRSQALAKMYRGVILAESSFKGEEDAENNFREAIRLLESNGSDVDSFRANFNYAGFQANRALDRLHNQSFQAASGTAHPLTSALEAWSLAESHYNKALNLAGKLNDSDRTAVYVNLARLYATLAEFLSTLTPPKKENSLQLVIDSVNNTSKKYANFVVGAKDNDAVVRGLAESILGQLALRQEDLAGCRKHAWQARKYYLEAGSVSGIETAHRLIGISYRKEKGDEARKESLRHLKIAWELGEFLRERYPAGKAGASRSGFFARRAPIVDLIVELLLEDGKPAEALAYVEQGRARSLQDFLNAGTLVKGITPAPKGLTEILAQWPKDAICLEYYLGSEKAWVFVVTSPGRVDVFPLLDNKGEVIPPAKIIQRVRRLIGDMDHLLAREVNRVLARNYDHGWQQDLHELYKILVPLAASKALKKSDILIVVPHHLLNYLPFAALVPEVDISRGLDEVPRPKFLIEEVPALVQVPSLTIWDRLRQSPVSPIQEVRAIGDPESSGLPGVAQDLNNLKLAFGSKVKDIHTGSAAHEANAKSMLNSRGLAFFGSHGQDQPDRPLDGKLSFDTAGSSGEDGTLTAAEIFARNVFSDLVVMSACYSGRADRSPLLGDDLFGLQRAFLQSGAKTVISGFWDVYDGKAPELMNGFFQQLTKGDGAALALGGAQRDFIKKYRELPEPRRFFTHPYFWAVYSVWGDDRTCFKP